MENVNLDGVLTRLPSGFESVIAMEETQTLATRLAENAIQANTAIRNTEMWVRVLKDGRSGLATGSSATQLQANQMVDDAIQAWKENDQPSPIRLPVKAPLKIAPVADPAIISENPRQRCQQLRDAVTAIQRHGMTYTGSVTTKTIHRQLVTSNDIHLAAQTTLADASCTVSTTGGSSGWARNFGTRLADIDLLKMARTAGGKALNGRNPSALEPGKHMVVLEPAAVGAMLLFLGFLSFGGRVFNRGSSFLSGKIGQKVMADHLTITDDSSDPRSMGWPFDYEGTPVEPVVLVEKGVARGVVHDMATAAQGSTRSTGHALAPGNGFGPYPRCVRMDGGDQSIADILKSLDQAVLVTRLWYINYANPMRTMITGTTRDGTFLMKKGRIARSLRNMRFVESILDAFNRSVLLSKETRYVRQFGSTLRVPYMVIPDFNFTEVI